MLKVSVGASCSIFDNLTERNKTQLNECLEAVADTQHQSVPILEQVMNSIHNLRVAEECCNELTAAFRFVTAAESARNHDNLGILNAVGKGFYGFGNCRSRQVADDKDFCSCTSPFKDSSGVIFAVCAWEYRNQDVRASRLNGRELVNRIVIAVNRRLFLRYFRSSMQFR